MEVEPIIPAVGALSEQIDELLQGKSTAVCLSALAFVMITIMEAPDAPERPAVMDAVLPHLKKLVGAFVSLDVSVYG